jgi:formate hydrogenlyase subunit 3/multisubunit Na+/H+ antiporter MnhD subunit
MRHSIGLSAVGDEQGTHYRGLARRTPLGLALFVFGGLSLAGFPLTPGFAGRWMVINSQAESSEISTIIFALSAAVGIIGIFRLLRGSLKPVSETDVTIVKETTVQQITEGLILGAGVILVIFPRILAVVSRTLANPF